MNMLLFLHAFGVRTSPERVLEMPSVVAGCVILGVEPVVEPTGDPGLIVIAVDPHGRERLVREFEGDEMVTRYVSAAISHGEVAAAREAIAWRSLPTVKQTAEVLGPAR